MIGKRVLVVGLGQIGYSNAEYMTMKGLDVDGFDINEKAVQRAIDDQVIKKKAGSFSGYDYYIICISTHRPEDMFQPHLDGLFEIAWRLSYEGTAGALVGIDSTVVMPLTRVTLTCELCGLTALKAFALAFISPTSATSITLFA